MHADHDFPAPTTIPVDGGHLEVFETGRDGGGDPVVLCHGWPDIARTWRHQVPALAAAGHHVIAPNQRGYGNSLRPTEVTAYDIEHLTCDLVALLDHHGYDDATFIGHDWGAMVVWGMALLHPTRVSRIVNLSIPYMDRGDTPWVQMLEALVGEDDHIVHINRHPGVADAVFEANTEQFLRNLYRTAPPATPLVDLALAPSAGGDPLVSPDELAVLVEAFESSGFAGGLHWYRNLDRNWHLLADVDPIVRQPTLMIHGERDTVMRSPTLADSVPAVEVVTLDAGHWIHLERPQETTALILDWLARVDAVATV